MNASGAILSFNAKSRTSVIPKLFLKKSLKYVIRKNAATQVEAVKK
jgi:hypothetical protein